MQINNAIIKHYPKNVMKAENPEKTMANFLACMARINGQQYHDEFRNSGFFILERKDTVTDTRMETMEILAKHFGLSY